MTGSEQGQTDATTKQSGREIQTSITDSEMPSQSESENERESLREKKWKERDEELCRREAFIREANQRVIERQEREES